MTALLLWIVIASLFTAIELACAVRIALPRRRASDPFAIPFGEMPGFSDAQLRAIARAGEARRQRDPLRRSFATRPLAPIGGDDRESEFRRACHPNRNDAGGGFSFILSGFAAARDFFATACRRIARHRHA